MKSFSIKTILGSVYVLSYFILLGVILFLQYNSIDNASQSYLQSQKERLSSALQIALENKFEKMHLLIQSQQGDFFSGKAPKQFYDSDFILTLKDSKILQTYKSKNAPSEKILQSLFPIEKEKQIKKIDFEGKDYFVMVYKKRLFHPNDPAQNLDIVSLIVLNDNTLFAYSLRDMLQIKAIGFEYDGTVFMTSRPHDCTLLQDSNMLEIHSERSFDGIFARFIISLEKIEIIYDELYSAMGWLSLFYFLFGVAIYFLVIKNVSDKLHILSEFIRKKEADESGSDFSNTDILEVDQIANSFKNLFKKLKENEQKFKDIATASGEYLWELDLEGRYTFLTKQFEDLLGIKVEKALGKTPFEFMPEDEAKRISQFFALDVVAKGLPFRELEHRSIHKDGHIVWQWVSGLPYYDENGTLVGYRGAALDITQHKNIILDLEIERELFSSGPVMTIEWDPSQNWPIRYISANCLEILGYSQEQMQHPTFVYSELIHPDDIEEIFDEVSHNIINHIDVYEQSYRLKTASGEYRWFYDFTKLIRNDAGELISIRGYMFDQTKLRETEEALGQERKRLSLILDGTNVGTWEWDIQSNETIFNERWANIIGYTLEELQPTSIQTWLEYLHPDDKQKSEALLKEHFEGLSEYYECECRMKHKDGHWVWVLDRGKVNAFSEEGKPLRMSGTHQDVTQKKEFQIALEKAKQRVDVIIRASGVGLWEFDMQTGEVAWDANCYKMLGYQDGQFLMSYEKWIELMHPEDLQTAPRELSRQIEQNGAFVVEFRLKNEEGSYTWIEGRGEPIELDAQKKPIKMAGVHIDQSKKKEIEFALKEAKEKAENASRSKSQFLANMSHEIRTPMNAIIGLNDMLFDTPLDAKQKDLLQKVNGSSKMLLAIINDILDYSKIEAGKLEVEYNEFHLEDILSQLKAIFANESVNKHLEMYFYAKSDLPYMVKSDQLRITQVLSNLLSNALKFTHHGSVVVRFELLEKISSQKVSIRFSVEDTGIGMTQEQIQKIFRPFSQADSSTTRKYGGTGLGLVISQKIVQALGGECKVESTFEKGTKFWFDLDLEVLSWEPRESLNNAKKLKVLIVDDEAISREILKDMITYFGCECDEANNGLEALEKVKQADSEGKSYDYVLLDWHMPTMDGKEASQKLHQMALSKELRTKVPTIMMISAYAKEEIHLEDAFVDLFLSKPMTRSAIYEAFSNFEGGSCRLDQPLAQNTLPRFEDTTVLLVEDNLINQEVASMMLHKVGINVLIAENGEEAITTYHEHQKKLCCILMDLQMPVMSGYEASRRIRQEDTEIPIIALTAAAMIEDREKSLEAGMNEHLGKPIDKAKLYEILQKYCKNFTQKKADQTVLAGDLVLDIDYLEQTLSSNELIAKLLKKMLFDLQNEYKDLASLLQNQDPEVQKMVHALKGVSGNLGAMRLYAVTESLDKKLKKEEEVSKKEMNKLVVEMEALQSRITEILHIMPKSVLEKLSFDEFKIVFDTIKKRLDSHKIVEETELALLIENLKNRVKKEELEEFESLVNDFEFDSALELMEQWKI